MADLSGLPPDLQAVIERAISQIDNLSVLIEGDFITPDEWQREMAGIIDQFHQEAVRVGADQAATPILNDTVQRLIDIQLAFLQNFANDIQGTDWLPAYNARAQMYGSAIKQAYWHGDVIRQTGRVLPLPAMPAEGTQCLCITTPQSRVFTEFGYLPVAGVGPGMKVLTHKLRWRRVLRAVEYGAPTGKRQTFIRTMTNEIVGCTDDHRWLTANGWITAQEVHLKRRRLYNVPVGDIPPLGIHQDQEQPLSEDWLFEPEVLLPEPIPASTPLYDLEVEEDHSFIIEGVITHNSNCKCTWRIETIDAANGDYDAYWERNVADSCQTCVEREAQWSPVEIREGELQL